MQQTILAKDVFHRNFLKFKRKYRKINRIFTYLAKLYDYINDIIDKDTVTNTFFKGSFISLVKCWNIPDDVRKKI